MSAPDIILVGASVRAAAASALRAGLHPWCLDLFCDSDLRAMAPAFRCPPGEYPHGLLPIFRESPPVPWVYTGGLENQPNLIREMAALRPLWGNGPGELAQVRSPFRVAKLLDEAGLPYLEVQHADSGTVAQDVMAWRQANNPEITRWLRKPLSSAGGNGISFADELPAGEDLADPTYYFQRYASGRHRSAVFVAHPSGKAELLGITRQLVGEWALCARPFQYCGSLGPIEIAEPALAVLTKTADVLTACCQLRGLFGIDFVLEGNTPWLVEVNPRYTASIEVLEYTQRRSLLTEHSAAFDPNPPRPPAPHNAGYGCAAKLIWYAHHRFVFPNRGTIIPLTFRPDRPFTIPTFADIPHPGEVIECGWPICSVLAAGWGNVDQCLAEADQAVRQLRAALFSRN